MFDRIDHIGIAVNDLKEALRLYKDSFKLEAVAVEEVVDQKVKIAIFPVGESKIELMMPTAPDGPIGRYLQKNGPGFHHVAFTVSDLEEKIAFLEAAGIEMVDKIPRAGAAGTKIAFLHPRSTKGLLIELCQHK